MDNSNSSEDIYHVRFLLENGSAMDSLTHMTEKAILEEVKNAKRENDMAHIDCCNIDGSYVSVRFEAVDLKGMIYQKYTKQVQDQREASRQGPRRVP